MTWDQCLNCEYDLRGCVDAKRCPECGVWVDVRGVAFAARRGVVARAFAIGFSVYFVTAMMWLMTYDAITTHIPAIPKLSAEVTSWIVLGMVLLTYLLSVPAYRIGRRLLCGSAWPWTLTIEHDDVVFANATSDGNRRIKRWPMAKLYTVSYRRVPGGCGIRIGTVRILGLVMEREFEVQCRPVEARYIVQHIQRGIDSKRVKPA